MLAMRHLPILLSLSVLTTLMVACDGDVPGRDVPRTLPPTSVDSVGAAGMLPMPAKPAKPVPQGRGPVYEADAGLKTA